MQRKIRQLESDNIVERYKEKLEDRDKRIKELTDKLDAEEQKHEKEKRQLMQVWILSRHLLLPFVSFYHEFLRKSTEKKTKRMN